MKKFFMGLIVGALLMFSSQIYAASSKLLGNEVDNVMDVSLEGKTIGQAAVIDGTSYIPVRTLAEEFNLKVNVSPGEIKLSNPTAEENAKKAEENTKKAADEQAVNDKMTDLEVKKGTIESNIESIKYDITSDQEIIAINQTKLESPYKEIRDVAQKNIDKLNQRITDNQTKLIQCESELADVNAQIAALETQGK